MKLKNIYLSILTFAALTACTSEEIIIDKPGPNAQAVPSVLVLGADMSSTPVETKTEDDGSEVKKDKGTGLLYALVFDAANGQLLGAAKSADADENKETMNGVIDDINNSNVFVDLNNPSQISGEDLSFDANEVVVTGLSLAEAKKVTVVLVANPVEDTRGEYEDERVKTLEMIIAGTSKLSFAQYSEEMWTSHFQDLLVLRNEDGTDYSNLTASQCFSMTLEPGINYVGTKNGSYDEEKWFSRKNIEIPLYRLVADINLTIKNEIESNVSGIKGGTFTVTSISPGKYYYSSCVPNEVVNLDDINESYISYTDNSEYYYNYWCKKINKGALPDPEFPWYKQIGETIGNKSEISTAYCTFEAGDLELKIKGTYQKGNVTVENVEYIYNFPANAIRRNKIYNLILTLEKEPILDGELIPLGDGLMLEIANMANIDYDVSFGD